MMRRRFTKEITEAAEQTKTKNGRRYSNQSYAKAVIEQATTEENAGMAMPNALTATHNALLAKTFQLRSEHKKKKGNDIKKK